MALWIASPPTCSVRTPRDSLTLSAGGRGNTGRAGGAFTGCFYPAAATGPLAGPPLAGAAFDAFGSYDAAIIAAAILSFAGAGGAYALRGARPLSA